MKRVILAGVAAGQVRIALPVGALVAVGDAREADVAGAVVARDAAVRQCVTERVADEAGGRGRAGEVALAGRIAPCALRVPVPGFDREVRVLAVGDGLPSGFEDWRECLLSEVVVDRIDGDTIDAGADRVARIDGVDRSGGVDAYGLRGQRRGGY